MLCKGSTSGEHGVAGAAPVGTAATRDRDEVHAANERRCRKEVVMSRPNSTGVRQCTPAWRHHKWVEIAMNKHGETRKVRCQHCDAEVLGIHKCALALSQNETSNIPLCVNNGTDRKA